MTTTSAMPIQTATAGELAARPRPSNTLKPPGICSTD